MTSLIASIGVDITCPPLLAAGSRGAGSVSYPATAHPAPAWDVTMDCGHSCRVSGTIRPGRPLTCLGSGCHRERVIVTAVFVPGWCKNCGARVPESAAHGAHYDLCLTCRGSRIPPKCPFRAADRVQLHGYRGAGRPGSHEHDGFRGVVEGYMGRYYLTGITDDGETWTQPWVALVRDGKPPRGDRFIRCNCCPVKPEPAQLALFAIPDEAA